MDLLSEQLRAVRMSGGVFFRSELSAPFGLEMPSGEEISELLGLRAQRMVPLHLVVRGSCEARTDGMEAIPLSGGDIAAFLHDGPHSLSSPGTRGATSIARLLSPPPYHGIQTIRFGGGGAVCTVICGFLFHERDLFDPLLLNLPEVLVVGTSTKRGANRAADVFRLIEKEAAESRPGGACLLARLAELMFIEVLRAFMTDPPRGQAGWLGGLRDPHVADTLTLFHTQTGRGWDMASVCREVGLSRSALAERFSRAVGEAPMRYLTRLRMQKATDLLRGTDLKVSAVASRVGYRSEVAFNRAFRRMVGLPPAAWRRQETQADPMRPEARRMSPHSSGVGGIDDAVPAGRTSVAAPALEGAGPSAVQVVADAFG